jgi:glycosyltransferase involved in cell wall biosynthesis
MKVLLTTHQFFPTPAGGTEVLARDTGLEMLRRGHEVHILTANRDLRAKPDDVVYEDYEYQGLKVRALGLPVRPGALKSVRREYDNELVARHAQRYVEELAPDVAHIFHAARLSASIIDVFKRAGVPIVFTATDFWAICVRSTLMKPSGELSEGPDDISSNCLECRQIERLMPRTHVLRKALYGKKFYRKTAERALAGRRKEHPSMAVARLVLARTQFLRERFNSVDAILAPSKVIYERLTANGIDPELVRMSPYGINVARFGDDLGRPSREEIDGIRLGYAGQIHPQKGVHLLIEAFKSLPHDKNVTLRIFGNLGQIPDYTRQLYEKADSDPRIEFVGVLPSEQIAEEMKKNVDVLVVPSMWYENTPVVILEAFAAKTPVVATDLGGISQVVHHEENGLLFGLGDAQDLARQLKRLVEEPELLRRYSENIGNVRTVEDNVDEVLELYERLVK